MSERISAEDLRGYLQKALKAGGVDPIQVQSVADILLWGELVGRRSYGLGRLSTYIERVRKGGIKCPCQPTFERISDSMARLDGDSGFGQHVGQLGMRRAIDLAFDHGVGIVGVRNSNFCGATGYFVHLAAEAGMIGLALSNSVPKVAAPGGVSRILGTNPFAFGAPRRNGESLIFDTATSSISGSSVRALVDKGEPLPEGMAIDSEGRPTTDPIEAEKGAQLSMGGAKGFGLSLMVEMLAAVITGAGVSNGVASMYNDLSEPGHNGHFLMALDVSRWLPQEEYFDRFEGLIETIRASSGGEPVRFPGEVRWRNYQDNLANGILVDQDLLQQETSGAS